jgi:hypothetical protein
MEALCRDEVIPGLDQSMEDVYPFHACGAKELDEDRSHGRAEPPTAKTMVGN